jgi:hypothetical protein
VTGYLVIAALIVVVVLLGSILRAVGKDWGP